MESTTTTVHVERDLQIKTAQQVCLMIPKTILLYQFIVKSGQFLVIFFLRARILMKYIKVARNSFVGRAQTGFQFTRETQKLKQTNKNGVALSSGFNILRRSFKSCV